MNLKFKVIVLSFILTLTCKILRGPELPINLKTEKIEQIKSEINYRMFLESQQYQFEKFLLDLAFVESSHNWKIWNEYGYIGLWQLGKSARKTIGYSDITFSNFKRNPEIFPVEYQIDAITLLLFSNYTVLKPIIDKAPYVYDGVTITKSGILAAAHLAGAGGVQRFFKTNGERDPKDANGTRLSYYLKSFSDYDFDLNIISHPNHNRGYLYGYFHPDNE